MTLSLYGSASAPVLRFYQRNIAAEAEAHWTSGARAVLAVLATGLGKSVLAAAIAGSFPGRILWLAHRDELIQQAQRTLEAVTGTVVEIEQANWRASKQCRIVVGSIQSMHSKRLKRFKPDDFSLVVVDETHHATAPTWRRVLDFFSQAKLLGLTATPDRSDERALGLIFERICTVWDILQGIESGFLVPISGRHVELGDVQLDRVKKTAGDLAAGELDEAMLKTIEGFAHETMRLAEDRQTLCFLPGVRTAEAAAVRLNTRLHGSAAMVSGQTEEFVRRQVVRDFREGRLKYLVNCQVFTEGFDAPEASCVAIGRPTLSRSLHAQMLGRGTRVLPGIVDHLTEEHQAAYRRRLVADSRKKDLLLLDFVGNSQKHRLITSEDVLGGRYTEAEVDRAKKKRKEGNTLPTHELLDAAREELRRLAAAGQARVTGTSVTIFNPFTIMNISKEAIEKASKFARVPATVAQKMALQNWGLKDNELSRMNKGEAMALLNEMHMRRTYGYCTYKQSKVLAKWGITGRVKFDDASRAIDYLVSNDWSKQRVDMARLHEIVRPKKAIE
jgi:superfamily II DNA or RNA helicase